MPLLSQYEHRTWPAQDGALKGSQDIAQTQDGALWIGTRSGLLRFDGARFVPHNQFGDVSIAQWNIRFVRATRDGSLWLGAEGRLGRVKNGQLRQYAVAGEIPALREGPDGVIWFTRTTVLGSQKAPLCSVSNEVLRCV